MARRPPAQNRRWLFTLFIRADLPIEGFCDYLDSVQRNWHRQTDLSYLVLGVERGEEEHRLHLQGACAVLSKYRFAV